MGNGIDMEEAPSTGNPHLQLHFYLSEDGDEDEDEDKDDFGGGDVDGKAFPDLIPNDSFLT
ncbi:hypothetical protein TIFTF001_009220 [Ficus carica]|uniref:Uncharacterized protein n=1 Tax=Ficus carica TaxID=3494 RepID=A0AA87ZU36_FICCA|nr:hypothetical protein TIFTF001_009220 [Ficus carica]